MTTLTVNGADVRVRLLDVDPLKLRLDPENPRLHSAYLTHTLSAEPSQRELSDALQALPEFQDLVDAVRRNRGCFRPPLVTADSRVLEGNRRVAALRLVAAEHPKDPHWRSVTVEQLVERASPAQEQAIRAKFHLENALPWDGLSQLAEYSAIAEREGPETLAAMLKRYRKQIEPLLLAGRCLSSYSKAYPSACEPDTLRVLVGLCGVKQIEPQVSFSRITRCIFTDDDSRRPPEQPFPLSQIYPWLAEGRFTRGYSDGGVDWQVAPAQAPAMFLRVRQAGGEALAYFLETNGSLAKAVASLDATADTPHWQQKHALRLTNKYLELLNRLEAIRRDESPDLHREAVACYHRLGQLLGQSGKEKRHGGTAAARAR